MKKILLLFEILLILLFSIIYYINTRKPIILSESIENKYVIFNSSFNHYGLMNTDGKIILNAKYDFMFHHKDLLFYGEKDEIQIAKINDPNLVIKTMSKDYRSQAYPDFLHFFNDEKEFIFYDEHTVYELPSSLQSYKISKEAMVNGFLKIYKDYKVGFINYKGEIIAEPIYKEVHNFSENGYAIVCLTNDYECGVINTKGEVVVDTIYNRLRQIEDEYYIGLGKHFDPFLEYKYGVAGVNNQIKVDFIYDWLIPLNNEKYIVRKESDFFIIHDNNDIQPLDYHVDYPLNDDMLVIKNDKYKGLIDTQGQLILNPIYESIVQIDEQYISVKKDGKWGLLNRDLEVMFNFQYDGILFYNNGLLGVRKSNTMALIDINQNIQLDYLYSEIIPLNDSNLYKVKFNQLFGLIDHQGNIILEPKYEEIREYNHFIMYHLNGQLGILYTNNLKVEDEAYDFAFTLADTQDWLLTYRNSQWQLLSKDGLSLPVDKQANFNIQSLGDSFLIKNDRDTRHLLYDNNGHLLYEIDDYQDLRTTENHVFFIKDNHLHRLNDDGTVHTLHSYSLRLQVNHIPILKILLVDVILIGIVLYIYKLNEKGNHIKNEVWDYFKETKNNN